MVARPLRKQFGFSVLLCLLTAGCTVDSAESRQRDAVHQLDDVLTLQQKNIELSAPWLNTDPAYIPQDILRQLKSNDEQMLTIGKTISADALDQVYPQLGTMFSQTFVKSFALHVEAQYEYMGSKARGQAYSPGSDQKANESEALRNQWAAWFDSRRHEIANAIKAKW
jgi:hypothetical protein